MNSKLNINALTKEYSTNIMVDKIRNGKYDTVSPHSTTLHRHTIFQIVWIYKGDGEHLIEQKKYSFSEGSLFLLAPHYLHQIKYHDVDGFVVSFSDTFLNKTQYKSTLLFYDPQECFIKVLDAEQELLNTEFEHLYHYFKTPNLLEKDIILQNYIHILLTKIKGFKIVNQGVDVITNNHKFKLAEDFISLVRNNFSQEKKIEFYIRKLAVSQRKLNDVICTVTGVPPARFIEQYTLNEAVRLVCFSNYTIKEIAGFVGYFDCSYFTKAFKKHFDKTPTQYRMWYKEK
ncbi:AraC family transcriptional regulator [Flammeovirga pectinis]|uniref:AraC family transcriptional regulator n=1 Tax=Flammeovirga pectinis TaxID=2494373 RepID=A0A3S9P6Y7_9BACT|nr:AraC family transcriptional regulator [Flammeovirga pectinis]AZQ63822.1 AraC family transcriptional regulator [Flammeovirga pectinis]